MIVTVHVPVAALVQWDAQCVGTSPFIVQAIVLNLHTSLTNIENNKQRINYKFLKFSYLYKNNRTDNINFKDKHRREPEGVFIETMALLLIDDTKTGASGGIFPIVGASTYWHLLVDKGDAYLLTFKAIVAISRRISVPTRGFRFHSRRR